jgi:hypothetical protein
VDFQERPNIADMRSKADRPLSANPSRRRNVLFLAWPAQSGPTQIHPQQTSGQRLTRLGKRPHSSDGEAAWNDHHGRKAEGEAADAGVAQRVKVVDSILLAVCPLNVQMRN